MSSATTRSALGFTALLLWPSTAFAQAGSGDVAAAEALFREGSAEMEVGNFTSACPKLEESFRLDPATGALLTLAACYERAGKLASAWVSYLDVEARAQKAGEKDRETVAHAKAEELAPRLPRLRIQLGPSVASLPGLEVRRDQTLLNAATLGSALPIDPGVHEIEVRATGYAPAKKSVTTAEGRAETVSFDTLEKSDGAPPPVTPPPTLPPERPGGLGGVQIGGIVVGSLGLAAVGVGFGFGAIASSATSDLEAMGDYGETETCPPGMLNDCIAKFDDASRAATISTILVISGSVLAGAGLVMILAGDSADPESARVELVPGLGGAFVRGSL